MRWPERIRDWITVLRQEAGAGRSIPWGGLLRSVLSGPVPRRVWFRRMRTCKGCPVYDRERRVCRKTMPDGAVAGCGCYMPFSALVAAPYARGCWGWTALHGEIGWPRYIWPSRWAKAWAVLGFVFAVDSLRRRGDKVLRTIKRK